MVQVAVGCGVAKPSDTIEVAVKNKNYSTVEEEGDGASADDDFRSFDTEDHMAVLTSEQRTRKQKVREELRMKVFGLVEQSYPYEFT